MTYTSILVAIDTELRKLQEARSLISGSVNIVVTASKRGRPKGSTNKNPTLALVAAPVKGKRVMTDEGRARIAAAQTKRWAAKKRADKKAAKEAAPVVA